MIDAKTDVSSRTTVTIRGKFNFACYDEFQRVIGSQTSTHYTVDLSAVEYIDSAALGMLLLLRERVGEDRNRVVLKTGKGQPAEVLKLANFGTLFTMS
jgi:anti-anti-sigma factor